MYKLLLCLRYLRTRYIALICIISVTLGVATLIVTNSVMEGFSHEMRSRMNGMMGDIIIDTVSLDGEFDADQYIGQIKNIADDSIAGITQTVKVPSLLYLETSRGMVTQQIMLVGIDQGTYAKVSSFGKCLQHPENREKLEFKLHENGYDTFNHLATDPSEAKPRTAMKDAGWKYRRNYAAYKRQQARNNELKQKESAADSANNKDPFAKAAKELGEPQGRDFDIATEQHIGIVLGYGLATYRDSTGYDHFRTLPGADVAVSFPQATMPPKAINEKYTIVDLYESQLGEFDTNFAFVPLRELQKSRGLVDPTTGKAKFNSIMIKLKNKNEAKDICENIRTVLPAESFVVRTWQDQNNPILQAVWLETIVLNILLFMIIAVAGFGILAIFFMIVVEKTRDIGILKSLGASSNGVMGIFMIYGLLLGLVGAGLGLFLGILIEENINSVADSVSYILGHPVFDPSVYFFDKIPTKVYPLTVAWVCLGSVLIAIIASVLPARRAARLHPVKALRYE